MPFLTEKKTSKKALARNSFSLGTLCSRERALYCNLKSSSWYCTGFASCWIGEGGVASLCNHPGTAPEFDRNNRQHFSSSSCSLSFRLSFLQYTSKCCKNNCGIFGSTPLVTSHAYRRGLLWYAFVTRQNHRCRAHFSCVCFAIAIQFW